jgi:uncharacterized Zn finger protein (UPF0148 family)
MAEVKPLSIRSCPLCRVTMVRFESAWHCPACGSTILDAPAKAEPQRPERPHETAALSRAMTALRVNATA